MTTKLISSLEILESMNDLHDAWPRWRDDPAQRLAMDLLHDAIIHIEAIEQAARRRANVQGLMQDIYQDFRTPRSIP